MKASFRTMSMLVVTGLVGFSASACKMRPAAGAKVLAAGGATDGCGSSAATDPDPKVEEAKREALLELLNDKNPDGSPSDVAKAAELILAFKTLNSTVSFDTLASALGLLAKTADGTDADLDPTKLNEIYQKLVNGEQIPIELDSGEVQVTLTKDALVELVRTKVAEMIAADPTSASTLLDSVKSRLASIDTTQKVACQGVCARAIEEAAEIRGLFGDGSGPGAVDTATPDVKLTMEQIAAAIGTEIAMAEPLNTAPASVANEAAVVSTATSGGRAAGVLAGGAIFEVQREAVAAGAVNSPDALGEVTAIIQATTANVPAQQSIGDVSDGVARALDAQIAAANTPADVVLAFDAYKSISLDQTPNPDVEALRALSKVAAADLTPDQLTQINTREVGVREFVKSIEAVGGSTKMRPEIEKTVGKKEGTESIRP